MMHFLLLSCEQATLLTEQKMAAGSLSIYRGWQLKFHLKICAACRRFVAQSAAIKSVFQKKLTSEETSGEDGGGIHISEEARKRILNGLRGLEF